MFNENSLDQLCAGLCYAMGIEPPKQANAPSAELCRYIDTAFDGKKVDRIVMYNPDAVAQWIYEKYPQFFKEADKIAELKLPFCTVMPSVTPVCFATMYTGAQPSVHGIRVYSRPVVKIDTLFDALIRAGKKPALIATKDCSMGLIFLERNMDYYLCKTTDESNAKAAELIMEDKHDFILIYNGNFDDQMHKTGPESIETLGELRMNVRTFAMFNEMIKDRWKSHRTLVGFCMDHGCHEIDGNAGSHGLDMEEDLNIVHLFTSHKPEAE